MLLGNGVTFLKMCGLDKERKNWKVGGQFGGGWNNVVRHCALINKHFKEF